MSEHGTDRSDFDSDREYDFSRLGNWIEDNLDADHSTASEMADAALDVMYDEPGQSGKETTQDGDSDE